MYDILEQISKNYNVGVDAISLKYCEQTITNAIVLSGASNTNQLKENLKLNDFLLSDDEIETLNSFKISTDAYWAERKKLAWN
ncbi:aldo/keto reductase [Polaribacter ponticola]|uniref:Aldo/keto reductase n=1 Tax=Polaribacter ponticola TaxID=2978475 RepID=A0ABT5SDF1_9FLAO|nr:aldo/keto reductase [Polaribacter sp. MSW5]MDD7915874.1 aldo/keto reductase [Polaribacter sp. MSW5]